MQDTLAKEIDETRYQMLIGLRAPLKHARMRWALESIHPALQDRPQASATLISIRIFQGIRLAADRLLGIGSWSTQSCWSSC